MTGLSLLPIFMIGLLGGLHCIGMCGGIVSAFSAASNPRKPFPVTVINGNPHSMAASSNVGNVLAYNVGRIASYAIAGTIVGGLAGGLQSMAGLASLQIAAYWLANFMLIALGLYLMDVWRGLAHLEALGHLLWRHIQPLMKPLLPVDSSAKAFALGGLWGWLPCGMVYSVLVTAMLSGSAASGASVMLAFGLGTLPIMLSLGLIGSRVREMARRRNVRVVCGGIVLAFGVLGLLRAGTGISNGLMDVLCLTPPNVGAQK